MRKTFTLLCLFTYCLVFSQQRAVTENGEEVILYDNGSWTYENEEEITHKEIPTNPSLFEKGKESTFLLKSNKMNMGFYLNPKTWSFKKATENEDAEYEFQIKDGDLYGMVITEKMEVPLESLKSIAVNNGKKVAPDLKIEKEEYRTVNGLKVLLLKMNGTTQGIKFTYYGYYFSSAQGSLQFITYTSQNLIDSYIPEAEKLLNGLVELK